MWLTCHPLQFSISLVGGDKRGQIIAPGAEHFLSFLAHSMLKSSTLLGFGRGDLN